MANYTFPIEIVVSGNFVSDQCQFLINDNVSIVPTCYAISTSSTTIYTYFDAELSAQEQTTLQDIITNFVGWPDELNYLISYSASLTVNSTDTSLNSTWSKVEGYLQGFDSSTGIFTAPVSGNYCYRVVVNSSTFSPNTYLTFKTLAPFVSGQSSALVGLDAYANYGDIVYMDAGDSIQLVVNTDTSSSVFNAVFKIKQL